MAKKSSDNSSKNDKPEVVKFTYVVPELGVSVEAESAKEAVKIAQRNVKEQEE